MLLDRSDSETFFPPDATAYSWIKVWESPTGVLPNVASQNRYTTILAMLQEQLSGDC